MQKIFRLETEILQTIYQYYTLHHSNPLIHIIRLDNSNPDDRKRIKEYISKDKEDLYFFDYSKDDNRVYLLALDGNSLKGILSYTIENYFIEINTLISVTNGEKEHKYRGVGSMLIAQLINDFKEDKNIIGIHLLPVTSSIPFYQKLGFKKMNWRTVTYFLPLKNEDEIFSLDDPQLDQIFSKLLRLGEVKMLEIFLRRGFQFLNSTEKNNFEKWRRLCYEDSEEEIFLP